MLLSTIYRTYKLTMNEIKTVAPIDLREYSQNQTYSTQRINQRIPINMMEGERERYGMEKSVIS